MISAAENSGKFQKPRFWKEKSVEDVVTLGPMAQATLVSVKNHIAHKHKFPIAYKATHMTSHLSATTSFIGLFKIFSCPASSFLFKLYMDEFHKTTKQSSKTEATNLAWHKP